MLNNEGVARVPVHKGAELARGVHAEVTATPNHPRRRREPGASMSE